MSFLSKYFKPSHRQKTQLFKILDRFPHSIGFYGYHKIQQLYNRQSLFYKIQSTQKSFYTIKRILSTCQLSLQGTNCVEIGSGWLPIFPYFLLFEGNVNKVATYDIHQHYQKNKIKALNRIFIEKYNLDTSHFIGEYSLPNAIEYFPKKSIETAPLANTKFVISRFVLEHVPPDIIESIHKTLSEKLSENDYILHLISPSDHRAYTDKSISLYDFLQYSQKEWDTIQTKFDYHNRLRLPQYLTIFKKEFEIVHLEFQPCKEGTPQFKMFKSLKIHSDFSKFSDEELTAGSINVLLRKKKAT